MLHRKHFAILLIISIFSLSTFLSDMASAHKTKEASTFHLIYEYIIQTNCASASCHSSAKPTGGLVLEKEAAAYEGLVGAEPTNSLAKDQGLKRVDPYYPENSLLMFKLTKPMNGHGSPMPRGGEPLSKEIVNVIRQWIVAGAPKEGKVKDMPALNLDAPIKSAPEAFVPPPPPNRGFQVHLEAFEVAPGGEREIFYAMKLPISQDVLVKQIDIAQPFGSHHFLLYRVLGDKAPEVGYRTLSPQDRQHDGIDRELVAGAQTINTSLTFPEGIGVKIYANAYYDFNSHFINLNQKETLRGHVYINFHTVEPNEVERIAEPFLVSNGNIQVPPGQKVETSDSWIVSEDLELVVLASHMHRHGKRFVVTRLDGTLLYQTEVWEDPGFLLFNPPIRLKKGDGLRYITTHHNDDKPYPLRFGYTSEDEMAIIFGYAVATRNKTH